MTDVDSRLRELARAEDTPAPEGFDERLRARLETLPEKGRRPRGVKLALIAACAIKIVGYYFAEVVIYGNWVVPFTSIPGNLIQIGVAAVITLIIIKPLQVAAEHTILKKA